MISLKNKVALITGASRGIGRATAKLFAKAGADIIINYLSDDNSAELVKREVESFGQKALLAKADISNLDEVNSMVTKAIESFGQIDILVNNAGVWYGNPIDGMNAEKLKETIDINLLGSFYTIMAVVPHMKKAKSGNIINISSTAGQRGEAHHSPYAATKGAIISLTKSLAPELAPFNIRVNSVAPGWVDTDMSHESLIAEDKDKILNLIPLGRAGTAEELAGPILFLASDLSTFITGEILNVNGGAVLCG